MSIQSLASVKAHLSAVVESVHETHDRVTVTKNGVPTVVVVAVEDLESLEETLATLAEEDTMRQLRGADREVDPMPDAVFPATHAIRFGSVMDNIRMALRSEAPRPVFCLNLRLVGFDEVRHRQ